MADRVLLLAYMFPPIVDGGAFRPAAFARYLPEFGYDPVVLTRPDSVNLPLDAEQLRKLPPSVLIERVGIGYADGWTDHFHRRLGWLRPIETALNKPSGWVARGIAWRVARRDELRRWEVTWMKPAIETGLELIARHAPKAIIATGPPFETLKAGLDLSQRTGVPLIADFRDPWTYGVLWNPQHQKRAAIERSWEARVVRHASRVVVVTPSMQRTMVQAYPDATDKITLVMNGFDDLDTPSDAELPPDSTQFIVSFVGSIFERRLPPVLFDALRQLRARRPEIARDLHLQLIGPSQCALPIADRLRDEGVADMVEHLGPMSHDDCRHAMRASHLLLHIEPTVSYAVSSKVFEYLAAGRPILGLVPPGSDDEWFLQRSGVGVNAGVSDAAAIATALETQWTRWRGGTLSANVDTAWLRQFHRREQTRLLGRVLDEVIAGQPVPAAR